MRHRVTTTKLNRPVGPRKALVKNLLTQLYLHESIVTTQAKAKLIKPLADRLIHQAKPRTIEVRRNIGKMIKDSQVLKKLIDTLAPRYFHLNSGFTRIIKLGSRRGDSALMVKLSLIEGKESSIEDKKMTQSELKATTDAGMVQNDAKKVTQRTAKTTNPNKK